MRQNFMRLTTLFFLLLLCSSISNGIDYNNPHQARIFYDTKSELQSLLSMNLDEVWSEPGYIEIITDTRQLDSIIALGYKTNIVIENLKAHYQSRLAAKDMGGYKTLTEINQAQDALISAYPTILSQKISLGKTVEDRDIWAVKISDNPGLNESEPAVLFASAIHAREVITPEVLLNLMTHLCQNYGSDPTIANLVDNREIWIVLVTNPDGYYHNEEIAPGGGGLWRKNRRNNGDGTFGVDLNRNFGHSWGFDDIGSSPDSEDPTYRGIGPFSEPETSAIRDFAIAKNFVITVFVHSYSNLVLWPWGFVESYTPDEAIFKPIGDSIAGMNGYSPGPGWILYLTNGTTDDWFYGEQTSKEISFPFTFEVGSYADGFWPELSRIPELVSENLEPCLFLCDIADHIYSMAPPLPPVLSLPDTVNSQLYQVNWTHDDSLNPAVRFELRELQDKQIIIDPVDTPASWTVSGFEQSTTRYSSQPTSFYSTAFDNSIFYFQSIYPYFVKAGDSLKVNLFFDIETNWDYAYVEVSEDGINFTPLPSMITTETNPNGNNRGHGITGSSLDSWIEAGFDLSAYVGLEVYFRFSYYTDQSVLGEGIYFDDIYPQTIFGTESVYSNLLDNSKTFTNRSSGDYWYFVRAEDNENQWSPFSDLKSTYVSQTLFCGDANNDSFINVADAVFLINFVFKDGTTPDPLELGEANGDGLINVGDAVFIINYVFRSGPIPHCL